MYQTSFKFYDLEPVQLELDFKMPEHLELDVNMDSVILFLQMRTGIDN